MIAGLTALLLLVGYPGDDPSLPPILAASLSTPRLTLTPEAAAGLSGLPFLTVAGPPGSHSVEPWLLLARLPWLLRAIGWEPRLLHNGVTSWDEAREELLATARAQLPVIWVWEGPGEGARWGAQEDVPPSSPGCFIALVAGQPCEPREPPAIVAAALLEAVSWAHAATCAGLSGVESLSDPYVAQGFGAYKRLFADLHLDPRAPELEGTVREWARRRRTAAGFLRWARSYLPTHATALEQAASCCEQEATRCLEPLTQTLASLSPEAIPEATRLLWQSLAWFTRAMEALEPLAMEASGLDSSEWHPLTGPDEDPAPEHRLALRRLARSELAPVRRMALRKLASSAPADEDVALFVECLRDSDALVRETALSCLEAVRPANLREIVTDALADVDPSWIHGNGPFERLLVMTLTRVREAEVPWVLARVGAACHPGDCRPLALPTWCAEGIVDLFGQASWPYLAHMLRSSCPHAREAAAGAAGRVGARELREELDAIAFCDTVVTVRCAALAALARMGAHEAIERLVDLASSPDAATRRAAVVGLIEAGEAARALLPPHVRRAEEDLAPLLLRDTSARDLLSYRP